MAHPYHAPGKKLIYRDPDDQNNADSAWNDAPHFPQGKDDEFCEFPREHQGVVPDPETIVKLNIWRKANPGKTGRQVEDVRFYAVVQREGDSIDVLKHTAHAVVCIGQSMSMRHNFVLPRNVMGLYKENGGIKNCGCEIGEAFGEREVTDLKLRRLAKK